MAVRIRLRRMGAKHQPHYRFVVADRRAPRNGRFIEELGHYNPTPDPAVIKVDEERALLWLSRGAQPSETVRSLFRQVGIMERFHAIRQGAEGTSVDAAGVVVETGLYADDAPAGEEGQGDGDAGDSGEEAGAADAGEAGEDAGAADTDDAGEAEEPGEAAGDSGGAEAEAGESGGEGS